MQSNPEVTGISKKVSCRAAKVSIQQAARFREVLALNPDSPTGLVWRVGNRGIGGKHRSPGDYAGNNPSKGVQRIGLDGSVFCCSVVRASLIALQAIQQEMHQHVL